MLEAIVGLAVLLASVVIHENAHGVVANALGDDTARKAKRITLNPMRHLDLVGSVVMPALLFFSTGSMFGYAKPVPVNPRKLQGTDRWGFAIVAIAGPISNLLLALLAGAVVSRAYGFDLDLVRNVNFSQGGVIGQIGLVPFILVVGFTWNLLLAAFNLLPIPPLDGSRLLRVFLGTEQRRFLDKIEPYGFLILLVLIVWLSAPLFRIVDLIQSGLIRLLPI